MGTGDKEIGEMGTFQKDLNMFFYFRCVNHFSFSRCCILFETDLARKIGVEGGSYGEQWADNSKVICLNDDLYWIHTRWAPNQL